MEPITLGLGVASLAGAILCAFGVLGSPLKETSLRQRVKFGIATALLLGIGTASMEKNMTYEPAPNQTHISVSSSAPSPH